ncbi:MAG: EamA family transporter [Deltaproteobacteria bacterium]|nr:EamA family transporter [Deltaproteobacteria bacterium]
MSLHVMLIVLFAALLHAAWNAFIKSGDNKIVETTLLVTGAGVIAAAIVPFVPAPAQASWPFLAASVAIHCAYFSLVSRAYRTGELSFAYPMMRGSAPLFTAVLTFFVVGEPIGGGGWSGILLLCAGILWLARDGWRSANSQKHSLAFALLNAVVIVAYTIVDGLGVRASQHAWSYVLWLFFLNMFPLLAIGLASNARAILSTPVQGWLKGCAGGLCSVCAYGLALWAMTHAPIALVAALRETSVLFGTALGAILLKEHFGLGRWLAAALITAGAVAMKAL